MHVDVKACQTLTKDTDVCEFNTVLTLYMCFALANYLEQLSGG